MLYDTPKGLSVVVQGKNKSFGEEVLVCIENGVEVVENKRVEFIGITGSVYEKIKKHFEDIEEYSVFEKYCSDTQTNLTVAKNNQKIVMEYYPTTHKIFLSGPSTYLWDEVFFEITSNLSIDARKIVSQYVKSLKELQNISLTYDEGILEQYLKCQLEDKLYSNKDIITDTELKWLKTSAFLIFTEIQLPEHFCGVAPSLKVIEGLLNRIFYKYISTHEASKFDYFEPNQEKTMWNLKATFKANFKNNKEIIQSVNKLYTFLHKTRHKLFHNDGIIPKEINNKKEAMAIFQNVISLLKKVQEKSDIIFA